MPTTRVERTLAASPEAIWSLVADPHHQPRWWPRVRRMEDVGEGRFTQVLMTEKGRGVRADYELRAIEPPRRLTWAQLLEGTPFDRLLTAALTTVALAPVDAGGTHVAIELDQQLRGWSRLVPFLFRRAARAQLREALDGLERVVVD